MDSNIIPIVICDRIKTYTSLFSIDTTLINTSEIRGVNIMFINPRSTSISEIDSQFNAKPIIATINPDAVPHLKTNEADLYSIPYHPILTNDHSSLSPA